MAGGRTSIRLAPEAAARFDDLALISAEWLETRRGEEKGFSVAPFEPGFVAHQRVGLLSERGRPVAFATVMTVGREATLGLLRSADPKSPMAMEFLICRLALALREDGFQRFSLGAALVALLALAGLVPAEAAGSWRDVDKRVSEKLQSLGVSVVGWDSLRYFWRRMTPDEAAADLAAVISAYKRKWGCDEVALIGFSFGASVIPFLYYRLDPSRRAHVAMISLLSPGQAADWEIRVVGWFGAGPSSAATPIAPAAAELPGERVQCFYGDRDAENSCALFAARGAEVFRKHGDHHMGGDYDLIARRIFDGFSRRAAGR